MPARATAAPARSCSNYGEGEPNRRAEECLQEVQGLVVIRGAFLRKPGQRLPGQHPRPSVVLRRLQGPHLLADGRVLCCGYIVLCCVQWHLLVQACVRRGAPCVDEGGPVGTNPPCQFPLAWEPRFARIRRLRGPWIQSVVK